MLVGGVIGCGHVTMDKQTDVTGQVQEGELNVAIKDVQEYIHLDKQLDELDAALAVMEERGDTLQQAAKQFLEEIRAARASQQDTQLASANQQQE